MDLDQLTNRKAFELAVRQHQAGRLAEAEQLYRQVLASQPEHADAMQNLGLIAHRMGRIDLAADLIRRAIALRPENPEGYTNLGNALRSKGKWDEAIAAHRKAIGLRPNYAEAHGNLGNLLKIKGQLKEAIASYRQAVAFNPNIFEFYNNLGIALAESGELDEAISAYQRAINLRPNFPEVLRNIGLAMAAKGRLDEALAAYHRAIALKADYADAFCSLGIALANQGHLAQSIDACRKAIALNFNAPEAQNSLGIVLAKDGQIAGAIAAHRQAIALRPNYAEAYINLGNFLRIGKQIDEAIEVCRKAIALNPSSSEAYNNLGTALKDIGRWDEAIAAFRQAIAIDPKNAQMDSNLVYAMHFRPRTDLRAIAAEYRRWNRQHAEPLRGEITVHTNDRSPSRRLRIGYVSPDFRQQAECYFVVPLLQAHDHENFEIHCYSSVSKPDAITQIIKNASDCWHDVVSLSDEELARRIVGDGIDILVDLTMHMGHHRLLTFARKPAPVQVTWLAYPGGTGLETMDYRITDAYMDPHGANNEFFSEAAILMPDCWVAYSPLDKFGPPNPPPVLTNGFITFGSLNSPSKLNEDVLKQWARALRAVEGSKLSMLSAIGTHREQILKSLDGQGIERQRVTFFPFGDRKEYLANYGGIDIGLDPFPYSGITTTCDALWMGVPVFTLPGATPASRAGMGLLSAANLPELIANNEDDLIHRISSLAEDIGRLASLRASLRNRVAASPLMDAKRFARNIEQAYRRIWQEWGK